MCVCVCVCVCVFVCVCVYVCETVNTSLIAGAVGGGVAVIIIAIGVVFFILRIRSKFIVFLLVHYRGENVDLIDKIVRKLLQSVPNDFER